MMRCGCAECNNSGYYDRVGIFEVLSINDELKELIVDGASSIQVKNAAFGNGYRPLVIDGIKKVMNGITNMDEIDKNLIIY
ncbi:MAG: hypothetical protein FWC53_03445 [Firmicutes bacterium]|nr:hypothetical protein [Bacillota bacterium]